MLQDGSKAPNLVPKGFQELPTWSQQSPKTPNLDPIRPQDPQIGAKMAVESAGLAGQLGQGGVESAGLAGQLGQEGVGSAGPVGQFGQDGVKSVGLADWYYWST